jgi:hypothetical protein
MSTISPWQDFEAWNQYGLKHRYHKRNPTSFRDSEDEKERSWYTKGATKSEEHWLFRFPFTKLKREGVFQDLEVWKQHGIEHGYDQRNPKSLATSKDKEERSWYTKGATKSEEHWLQKFPFTRRSTKGLNLFSDFETWEQHGLERGYDKRNRTSLAVSEDKEEQRWYRRGNRDEKWLHKFSFTKKTRRGLYPTFEVWLDVGMQKGYNQRGPTSLARSENKDEVAWYRKGDKKREERWLQKFPFTRKKICESILSESEHLEDLLKRYVEE